MLTKIDTDGTWSVKGIELDECTPEMYSALSRLRDYERTGLNPEDLKQKAVELNTVTQYYFDFPSFKSLKSQLIRNNKSIEMADTFKRKD